MKDPYSVEGAIPRGAGLCATCVHSRAVRTRRGSLFVMCGLSARRPELPRYPPLPVRACPGYQASSGAQP